LYRYNPYSKTELSDPQAYYNYSYKNPNISMKNLNTISRINELRIQIKIEEHKYQMALSRHKNYVVLKRMKQKIRELLNNLQQLTNEQ